MSSDTVLICPPTFFDVTYAINPWMKGDIVDRDLAKAQWDEFHAHLVKIGVSVKMIPPMPGLPDLIFTANAGTIRDTEIVLSNFRHPERQPEREEFNSWFQRNGYITHVLPDNVFFEGCGDTIVTGNSMIAGYGFRSDKLALNLVADLLDLNLIPLKLKDPRFYHLDTCFCLLRSDLAIYHPGAFSKQGISKLKNIELIPIVEEDALRFACNSIVYDDNILMPAGCNQTAERLRDRGFDVKLLDTSEFLKSGGSLQCMALWI